MSIPLLTQLKKAAQKNKAYTARKNAKLAETMVAALTELQENTQPAPLRGAVTIPVSEWNSDAAATYPYYYDIAILGVTALDYAAVTIAPDGLETAKTCGLCSSCESMAGKIRLRTTIIPTAAIRAEYWIKKGKE